MLRRVRVQNFKSFVHSTFPLAPLTLVLGANASGKSNFFDALRFLRYIGSDTSIRDAIEGHTAPAPTEEPIAGIRGGQQEVAHFGSGSSVFRLDVEIDADGARIDYGIAVDVATYRVVSEELVASTHPGPYVFSTDPEVDPLVQEHDAPGITARFYKNQRGTRPKREFNPYNSILSQFEGRRAESTLNEDVADVVRRELGAIAPLELRPEVLRAYSRLGGFELGEHGENFAAAVWYLTEMNGGDPDAQARLEAVYSWLRELTPQVIAEVGTQVAPTGDVIFAVKEGVYDRWITARSLSDGTLRFAALAFALIGSDRRRTFAVEELENGVNPTRLELLLRMIEASTNGRRGVQVVASTHSPQVLDLASEQTIAHALVIGWDTDAACSHASLLSELPHLDQATAQSTFGDLQAEGWLQYAADR